MRSSLVYLTRRAYVIAPPNRAVQQLATIHCLQQRDDAVEQAAAAAHVYSVRDDDDNVEYDCGIIRGVNVTHVDSLTALKELFGTPSTLAEFILLTVCDPMQFRPHVGKDVDFELFLALMELLSDVLRHGLLRDRRTELLNHLLPRLV